MIEPKSNDPSSTEETKKLQKSESVGPTHIHLLLPYAHHALERPFLPTHRALLDIAITHRRRWGPPQPHTITDPTIGESRSMILRRTRTCMSRLSAIGILRQTNAGPSSSLCVSQPVKPRFYFLKPIYLPTIYSCIYLPGEKTRRGATPTTWCRATFTFYENLNLIWGKLTWDHVRAIMHTRTVFSKF